MNIDEAVSTDLRARLFRIAKVAATHDLVDAFGHLSLRTGPRSFVITPARPLGLLGTHDRLIAVDVDCEHLPVGAPKEAWMHAEAYLRRPGIGGVARVQPPAVAAADAASLRIIPVTGHAAMLAPSVASFGDSRLVRSREQAARLLGAVAESPAVMLRGNGALTFGTDPETAVALAWVLERTAAVLLAAGERAKALPEAERASWAALAPELLPRIYRYLEGSAAGQPNR